MNRAIITVVFLVGLLACSPGGAPLDPGAAGAGLRLRFPAQAAKVLEAEDAFVVTDHGFGLGAPRSVGSWQRPAVALPDDGGEPIRVRGRGGSEVQVREVGAAGKGALAGGAVAYRRAGGTSFWTAAPGGVEEWLHLEAGAVRGGEAAAAWEVTGATVQQQGDAVELVDAGGVVLLSVTAPSAYATGGRAVEARLSGSGARIELWVAAGGDEVLVDPLWVSTGPMNSYRRNHTATLLPSGQVLVTGGLGPSGFSNTAERYEPMTYTWTLLAPMGDARSVHTATLLPNGKVLVAGGSREAMVE